VILHRAGQVERLQMNSMSQPHVLERVCWFAGVDTHYFMMAVINPGQLRMEARPLVVNATPTVRRPLVSSAFKFAGGATNK
jgi:hypothetical protein